MVGTALLAVAHAGGQAPPITSYASLSTRISRRMRPLTCTIAMANGLPRMAGDAHWQRQVDLYVAAIVASMAFATEREPSQ
jgi:hypothetical protein